MFYCLFGANFMLTACSEVKVLIKKDYYWHWLQRHVIYGKSGKPGSYV